MRGLRTVSREERLGARRWDAILLGSGIASLVAAIRIGMAGHRVLVVEEDRSRDLFPGLREPFFLAGARDQGLLDTLLLEITVPLIERRRVEHERLALQVVGPDLRLDVGDPSLTASELVAWGIAKPDAAQATVRALVEAAEAERQAMLAAPVVRLGRRLTRARPGSHGSHVRGLPAEAARPSAAMAELLASQIRALSNLGDAPPSPEARARLLGSLMGGAAGFGGQPPWLYGILRHRAESVHAEFRSLSGGFEIVDIEDEPGLMTEGGQLWLGRALVLAAPESAVAAAIAEATGSAPPALLDASRSVRRRLAIHLRCKKVALPEAMCRRVISRAGETAEAAGSEGSEGRSESRGEGEGDRLGDVCISLYAAESDSQVEIVARALPVTEPEDDEARSALEDRLEQRVRTLIPFAGRRLTRRPSVRPRWDDDDLLEDPPPGQGWPAEIELRVNARPPVYRLDRAGIASLGFEGDLLLGWRGGDALAAEL